MGCPSIISGVRPSCTIHQKQTVVIHFGHFSTVIVIVIVAQLAGFMGEGEGGQTHMG